MSKKPPEWDSYLQKLTVRDLQRHLPLMGAFERITLFSEDRAWILLASLDLDASTSDVAELKRLLPQIADGYRRASTGKHLNHKQTYRSYVDFVAVCNLLAEHAEDADRYSDPDALLSTMSGDDSVRS